MTTEKSPDKIYAKCTTYYSHNVYTYMIYILTYVCQVLFQFFSNWDTTKKTHGFCPLRAAKGFPSAFFLIYR